MTHKQTIVKEARLQGKTAKQCAALSGLSIAYCRHLISGAKGTIKNDIIKINKDIQRKMRLTTTETREGLIADLRGIADDCRQEKPGISIKALDHIGRMIGAYGEDNKQKNTLGSALADMVKTRTALAASSVGLLEPANDRHQQSTIDAEIVDSAGRDEAKAGAEGETGGGCDI